MDHAPLLRADMPNFLARYIRRCDRRNFVRVADRKGSIGLPDDERQWWTDCSAARKAVVVACLAALFGSALCSENLGRCLQHGDVANAPWAALYSGQTAIADDCP